MARSIAPDDSDDNDDNDNNNDNYSTSSFKEVIAIDTKKSSNREMCDYTLGKIRRYIDARQARVEFFYIFKEDFAEWDINVFKRAGIEATCNLHDILNDKGVFIP